MRRIKTHDHEGARCAGSGFAAPFASDDATEAECAACGLSQPLRGIPGRKTRARPPEIVQVHLKPGEGALLDAWAEARGLLYDGKPSRGKALRAMMSAALP